MVARRVAGAGRCADARCRRDNRRDDRARPSCARHRAVERVGWSNARTIGTLLTGLVLLGAFVVRCAAVVNPVLALDLFSERAFRFADLGPGWNQRSPSSSSTLVL